MNPAATSFVLAYHGCDERVASAVTAGRSTLRPSHNDYDWLGDGIYFWEHNAQRAYEYAAELAARPRNRRQRIERPAVLGAVVDLGFCLNLLDSRYIQSLREAHDQLAATSAETGLPLPDNAGGADLLRRKLDCAVIRTLHQMRRETGEPPFDTVRSAFVEGERVYDNAGFASKNHIQICVRTIRCIKGYFRPLDDSGKPIRFGRARTRAAGRQGAIASTKERRRFREGDRVRFIFGMRPVEGVVKEDRGPIGIRGRRLYLVEFGDDPESPMRVELPAVDMEPLSGSAGAR